MNYNINEKNNQVNIEENFIKIPAHLERFVNTVTIEGKNNSGHDCYFINGYVELSDDELICDKCGCKMHINDHYEVKLKHIPIGNIYSYVCIDKRQLICLNPDCKETKMQIIPFQDGKRYITNAVKTYTEDLLSTNNFNNKEVSYITGLNRNLVKAIDKVRLEKLYTVKGEGKELIKPEQQATFLGIDEFKLHDGYKYATHIINYDNGHILWIAKGKKKQVVYDFINHVGLKWMSKVVAVACDMNSDFEEAFLDKCPHIKIVYDYFHIKKNFNEKVVSKIRIEEQNKLIEAGDKKAAQLLKGSRFILFSSEDTLKRKDEEVKEGKIISKGSGFMSSF